VRGGGGGVGGSAAGRCGAQALASTGLSDEQRRIVDIMDISTVRAAGLRER
jgi:hypothetical protein